tara:strand:- start:3957 stop:4727 length:771 start_codon:yes stop_codon:yes gene_type:complete
MSEGFGTNDGPGLAALRAVASIASFNLLRAVQTRIDELVHREGTIKAELVSIDSQSSELEKWRSELETRRSELNDNLSVTQRKVAFLRSEQASIVVPPSGAPYSLMEKGKYKCFSTLSPVSPLAVARGDVVAVAYEHPRAWFSFTVVDKRARDGPFKLKSCSDRETLTEVPGDELYQTKVRSSSASQPPAPTPLSSLTLITPSPALLIAGCFHVPGLQEARCRRQLGDSLQAVPGSGLPEPSVQGRAFDSSQAPFP